jgi:hypothetical protein
LDSRGISSPFVAFCLCERGLLGKIPTTCHLGLNLILAIVEAETINAFWLWAKNQPLPREQKRVVAAPG